MATPSYYEGFQDKVVHIKNDFIEFLNTAKTQEKTVIGYGAAAKGNTLINYAGINHELIPFVVDKNPAKQGKFLPGSRIPIKDPSEIEQLKPDYVVILPWNIADEVKLQLSHIKKWGAQFVTAIPEIKIT